MRVLHVFETLPGGPATYFNEIIAPQVAALGADNVRALVPDAHVGFLRDASAPYLKTFGRRSRWTVLPGLARAVHQQVQDFRPHIIHAHSTLAGLTVRMLAAAQPTFPAVVYCPHGWVFDMETLGPLRPVARRLERALSPLCESIVAISQHEFAEGLRAGIPPERMVVIENGISSDIPSFVPVEWFDKRLKVLFVGRLDRQKGVDVLLEAAARLQDRAVFRVIGAHINNKNDLLDQLPANVQLMGWRSPEEICGHLAVCDLVAMPSRWEGFGLVALEAMRSQKPVVASAVGGLQSVVVHEKTGLLVPPGEAAALAGAIASRTKKEWAQLGASGYARFVERYRSERTNSELMQLYRSILGDWPVQKRRIA